MTGQDTLGLDTAVLLLVFNRPSTTRVVLEAIRAARPRRLYVAADGPRPSVPSDAERCKSVRQLVTQIDWDCAVQTLFRDENRGSGHGIVEALSWFFEAETEGIILEDDCVPAASFFSFCSQILTHHRSEPRVMHISGSNYQYGFRRGHASYYYSTYAHSGAWATWRRAWEHFDFATIPEADRTHVWDAAWHASVRRSGGLAVVPNVNLVTNIGFGEEATHTVATARYANLPRGEMQFPLEHPERLSADRAADTLTYYANYRNIPDLRLVPLFEVVDFFRLLPVRLHKLAAKIRPKHLLRGSGKSNA